MKVIFYIIILYYFFTHCIIILIINIIIGFSLFFNWIILVPFFIGGFYYLIIDSIFGNSNNFINTLSLEVILRMYFFGFVTIGYISNLILTGLVDSVLLTIGYVPIYENIVFAIITTWNTIVNNNYPNQNPNGEITAEDINNHKMKVLNDIRTLNLLIPFKTTNSFRFKFLILIGFVVSEKYFAIFDQDAPKRFYRGYLFALCVSELLSALSSPISQWLNLYYQSIKNENYLIGMELQNSPEVLLTSY